jgi:hypothetical protein
MSRVDVPGRLLIAQFPAGYYKDVASTVTETVLLDKGGVYTFTKADSSPSGNDTGYQVFVAATFYSDLVLLYG